MATALLAENDAAASYYDSDFDWQHHAQHAAPLVAATTVAWRQHPASQLQQGIEYKSWETFHAQHDTARFFKERRYITLAFPQLLQVCRCLATSHPNTPFTAEYSNR